MDKWLNYHHLFYFKTIAEFGSVTKAAGKLHLGQSALSTQLMQFEDKLGVLLFERKHKKLILTEAGMATLDYANEIFKLGSELLEVLQDRLIPQQTHVQLGALDSIPKNIIYSLIKAAYKINECNVTVLEGKDDELLRELAAHRIDLILTNHLPRVGDGVKIVSKSIAKLPIWVCGHIKFSELKRDFPKSLMGKPFILPTHHSFLRASLDHFFKLNQISVKAIAETQDTSLQKIIGSDGLGLMALSSFEAGLLLKETGLKKIGTLPGVFEEIYLVAAARKIENPISSALFKSFSLT
ncbi:MAG: LysR family transcriptional regulator [Oligoflexia bacterium]|nr:LysR family transcriptional regulator [Oligoflexia bacterium]